MSTLTLPKHETIGLAARISVTNTATPDIRVSISIVEGSRKAGKVLVDSEEMAETLRRGEIPESR